MVDTVLSQQIPLAVISTYLIEWLKTTKYFPFLSKETEKLNRYAGVIIAALSSVGILVTFDHTAGILTISGLTAINLLHVAGRFIQQWTLQQVAYKTVVSSKQSV